MIKQYPEYLDRVLIYPDPSIADPAHLVTYSTYEDGLFEGGWVVRVLIRLLAYFIRREIRYHRSWQTGI